MADSKYDYETIDTLENVSPPAFIWLARWEIKPEKIYVYGHYVKDRYIPGKYKIIKGRYIHNLFLSEETARKFKPKWGKALLDKAICTIIPYAQIQILRPILSAKVKADKVKRSK